MGFSFGHGSCSCKSCDIFTSYNFENEEASEKTNEGKAITLKQSTIAQAFIFKESVFNCSSQNDSSENDVNNINISISNGRSLN